MNEGNKSARDAILVCDKMGFGVDFLMLPESYACDKQSMLVLGGSFLEVFLWCAGLVRSGRVLPKSRWC